MSRRIVCLILLRRIRPHLVRRIPMRSFCGRIWTESCGSFRRPFSSPSSLGCSSRASVRSSCRYVRSRKSRGGGRRRILVSPTIVGISLPLRDISLPLRECPRCESRFRLRLISCPWSFASFAFESMSFESMSFVRFFNQFVSYKVDGNHFNFFILLTVRNKKK